MDGNRRMKVEMVCPHRKKRKYMVEEARD